MFRKERFRHEKADRRASPGKDRLPICKPVVEHLPKLAAAALSELCPSRPCTLASKLPPTPRPRALR